MARLTVGVPVFNGERYLAASLDSLLAQTYGDFELIVADNASTDSTGEICLSYAKADPRVTYIRHDHNLGAAENHNFLVHETRTELFKWSASDDLHAPEFVERCIAALDADSEAISAYARTTRIDADGARLDRERYPLKTASRHPHVRFRSVVARQHSCFSVFAVYRTKVLQGTGLMGGHAHSDRILLAELALLGPSIEVKEDLLFRRMHRESFSSGFRGGDHDPERWWLGKKSDPDSPRKDSLRSAYEELVAHAPLSDRERRRCQLELATVFPASQFMVGLRRRYVWPLKRRVSARLGRGSLSGRVD